MGNTVSVESNNTLKSLCVCECRAIDIVTHFDVYQTSEDSDFGLAVDFLHIHIDSLISHALLYSYAKQIRELCFSIVRRDKGVASPQLIIARASADKWNLRLEVYENDQVSEKYTRLFDANTFQIIQLLRNILYDEGLFYTVDGKSISATST